MATILRSILRLEKQANDIRVQMNFTEIKLVPIPVKHKTNANKAHCELQKHLIQIYLALQSKYDDKSTTNVDDARGCGGTYDDDAKTAHEPVIRQCIRSRWTHRP